MNVVGNLKGNYAKRGVESEIQVVAFGQGIQMLKDDAVVANRVRETMKGGAQMLACESSMGVFKLTKDMMVDNISYSETGVIYIIRSSARAGRSSFLSTPAGRLRLSGCAPWPAAPKGQRAYSSQ